MRSLLLLSALSLLVAPDEPKQDSKVPEELLGVWVGKSSETFEKSGRFPSVWEVKEEKIISTLSDRVIEIQYRADAQKNPKEIDLTYSGGPSAGKARKGIYKIENNVLTICNVRPNADGDKTEQRPADFDAKKRSDIVILTFERKKP